MNGMVVVWVSLVVAAGLAATLGPSLGGAALSDVQPAAVGTTLTGLLFVALLIERAVEVFIAPLSGEAKGSQLARQGQLRRQMAETQAAMAAAKEMARRDATAAPQAAAALAEGEAQLHRLREEDSAVIAAIAALDARTQRLALSVSVPLSLLIALSGVRALDGFATTPEGSLSGTVFTMADVVLTAGLLAGGADGIHKVIDRMLKLAAGKDVQQPAIRS